MPKAVATKTTRATRTTKAATTRAKPVAKKTVARKAPAKKVVARKTATVRKTRAVKAKAPRMTKASFVKDLAAKVDVTPKEAKAFLDGLTELVLYAVSPKGGGTAVLPGLLKVVTRKVAARKGGKMVLNRFTGEMVKQKAKPASVRVKVRPMLALKQAAG